MSDAPSWSAVEQLRDTLEQHGFMHTWSYDFVTSILSAKEMPRGRGSEILKEYLTVDWAARGGRAAEIEALIPSAGIDGQWLDKMAADIRRGFEIPDWRAKRLEEIKAKLAGELPRALTPDEAVLLADISKLARGRGLRWWSMRPAQDRRFRALTAAAEAGQPIYIADFNWIKSMFKGPLEDLQSDKYPPGCLCTVHGKMAMVIGKQYVSDFGHVVVDVIPAGDVKTTVQFALLRKRIKGG
jgi:hypothetical protein